MRSVHKNLKRGLKVLCIRLFCILGLFDESAGMKVGSSLVGEIPLGVRTEQWNQLNKANGIELSNVVSNRLLAHAEFLGNLARIQAVMLQKKQYDSVFWLWAVCVAVLLYHCGKFIGFLTQVGVLHLQLLVLRFKLLQLIRKEKRLLVERRKLLLEKRNMLALNRRRTVLLNQSFDGLKEIGQAHGESFLQNDRICETPEK